MIDFTVSTCPPAVNGFLLFELLAYFLIYSCMGWCLEVVYAAVTTGKLVNRGFLNGPVCPIYGFGMLGVLFLLTPLQDNIVLLYIGGVVLPSAVELAGGWALYRLYHTRWWDYSDKPFNLGGYICLGFSLLWGVGTLIMVRIIHPVVAGLVWLLDPMDPPLAAWLVVGALYLVYAADVVLTAFDAAGLVEEFESMERAADSIHAVSDAMTVLLGTTAMEADQRMDESRLQIKLAAAEVRETASKLSAKDASAAMRQRADDAAEAARRITQDARLNAAEAAEAVKLAAQGTAERTAELLRLEQLSEELRARTEEMQFRILTSTPHRGKRRILRAFPALLRGTRRVSLEALREKLQSDRSGGGRKGR